MDNTQDVEHATTPARSTVYTSQDGVNFNSVAVDSSPGAFGKTVFSFTKTLMRAIRIKVQIKRRATSNWWSIGEIQTDCTL